MDKAFLIKMICELLLNNKKQDCIDFAEENYPFVGNKLKKRQYSKYQMCRVFLRDGFIDRYSGDKLLFPGLIKILSMEFPDIFKYHRNWKISDTHMIYWDLCPTIDHLIPITRGGQDIETNWITTWTVEELGWKIQDKGELDNWDGLIHYFIDLTNKNPNYEQDIYIYNWKFGLRKAMMELKME